MRAQAGLAILRIYHISSSSNGFSVLWLFALLLFFVCLFFSYPKSLWWERENLPVYHESPWYIHDMVGK